MKFRESFEKSYCKIFMSEGGGESIENIDSVKFLRNGDSYDDEHLNKMWEFANGMKKALGLWRKL